METKNMIGGIVSLAVVVICVAVIMMPVLSEATKTTETFTNEGVFNYGVFGTTDTYTFEFDATDGSITANGETVTPLSGVSTTSHNAYSVIAAEEFLFRYSTTSAGVYYIQIVGLDSTDTTKVLGCTEVSATIADGQLSVTYSTSSVTDATLTFDFTEMYAIVPDADEAVLKASADSIYIKGDSELYSSGLTTVTGAYNMFHFEGTYDDGITITSPNLTGATFDNVEWNIEEVEGYDDLYKLTSVEFDITSGDTTVHATYSYFGVPTEVTANVSDPLGDAEIALINAIPVLVIVSIVVATVGMLVVRNRD